ncbi:MAG: asparagine synthase (glutamine-hydrolyzing) [Polyangiaceae bacterium]
MCGIGGVVRFDRPATSAGAELTCIRQRLAHRGPDGHGERFLGHAALCHTRLAMVDRRGGAQPLASADGRWHIVYNGELHNHHALRAELRGPFRTRSDTETVLAAFIERGEACLADLDGMFAFFVWDEERQEGFAARDRLGVKPFAWCRDPDGALRFASEAKALIADRPHADLEAIVEYLVAPAFSGVQRSPFAGIHYLPPGHLLRVGREGVEVRRWWRWSPAQEQARARGAGSGRADERGAEALADAVHAALEEAVRGALRADVPLGIFSSGGLDSTAIGALARPQLAGLPAFTIHFAGQERWGGRSALVVSDDAPHAAAAAAALGFDARRVEVDRAHLADELVALAAVNDALPAWEQELAQRALARAASAAGIRGVLVGDAADETHYGYHFLLDDDAVRGPEIILARLGSVGVRREVDPDPVARLTREYRALSGDAGDGAPEEHHAPAARTARVLRTMRLVVERWLPRLLHNGDIHTMAFGVEARVPFAAAPLLALAERVPVELALQGGVEKHLLREALRGVVPEAIRTRRKSALPKDQDAGPTYQVEARRVLADPHPLLRALVEPGEAHRLAAAPSIDERDRARLFRIVSLHHWACAHAVAGP